METVKSCQNCAMGKVHYPNNTCEVCTSTNLSMWQPNELTKKEYMDKIAAKSKHFLSINREIDEFRVSDICPMKRVSRSPFWYRRGYVEEDYVPESK